MQEQSRPSLCWMLICQACRLAQAIGLHRKCDASRFHDRDEYEERKWVFWMVYSMEKALSLTFGRTVCMPDFDIDVETPQESEEIEWPLFMSWIQLAKIQSRIYEQLYSAAANASGDGSRHIAAMELDRKLRSWSSENMKLRDGGQTTSFAKKYCELELTFNFHNSLVMIHRVNHGGGSESQEICLTSARDAISSIRDSASQDSVLAESSLVLWSRPRRMYHGMHLLTLGLGFISIIPLRPSSHFSPTSSAAHIFHQQRVISA